ncbi:uncharacterized protein LDX57_010130 [Aspergillus melleus]|uniref:uncharacterized protein n=1 Tax=Aspergillus melleus TaxID=138277 RepID=UPI001E8D32A8|nr:uncharacterized protein LDX57_010130 [Aspergillus melleus]KAH8432494.1 hypothetical protein LDX57_010130 [Aspergillus melleus]
MDPSGNNSPIGKQVWLATESVRAGTITHTFDNPSAILPYPAGYTHDLSLITDENLPTLVSPPGYPVISEWATYSNALSGCSVYAARQNVVVGRWATLYETIDPDAFRGATVCGADYPWDREARSQTAALLWNTLEPFTPAIGWSGSVLCVGQPTDTFSRAVVFQNYEVEVRANEKTVILKAGFLLPKAIRVATIVTNPED